MSSSDQGREMLGRIDRRLEFIQGCDFRGIWVSYYERESPVSFFDTTPMGITILLLSKDQDTIDQDLPLNLMQVRNHAGLYVRHT